MWPQASNDVLVWLGVVSALSVVGSIGGVVWFVARMPGDYFSHKKREPAPELFRSGLICSDHNNLIYMNKKMAHIHLINGLSGEQICPALPLAAVALPSNRTEKLHRRHVDLVGPVTHIRSRPGSTHHPHRHHVAEFPRQIPLGTMVSYTLRGTRWTQLGAGKAGQGAGRRSGRWVAVVHAISDNTKSIPA